MISGYLKGHHTTFLVNYSTVRVYG